MRILLVYWLDAGLKMGWQDVDVVKNWTEDESNFLCTTVGFVAGESDEFLVLIQGDTKGSVLNPVRIQKENIVGIEELNNGSKEDECEETEYEGTEKAEPNHYEIDSIGVGNGQQVGAVEEAGEPEADGVSPFGRSYCIVCQGECKGESGFDGTGVTGEPQVRSSAGGG